MPRFDVTAAMAEMAREREPIEIVLGGKEYVFPGMMPAEVQVEQMALAKELAGQPDNLQATAQSDRMMRAAFGEHADEIMSTAPLMEQIFGLQTLMKEWAKPYEDPNSMTALMTRAEVLSRRDGNSNSASSSTSAPSKRTSNGSTESTSRERSSSSGSPGADSSLSTAGSRASP